MQRGIVLHYSKEDGMGQVITKGTRYIFEASQWIGDAVPSENRVVDLDIRDRVLITVNEISEEVLLMEKVAWLREEAIQSGKGLTGSVVNFGQSLVALLGWTVVVAQILFILSTFGLPIISTHILWFTGSASLYELLSNPLLHAPALYLWALYASCVVVLVPRLLISRMSWLALLLPLLVLTSSALLAQDKFQNLYSGLGAIVDSDAKGLMRLIHFEAGFYGAVASSLVMAWLGLRRFFSQG